VTLLREPSRAISACCIIGATPNTLPYAAIRGRRRRRIFFNLFHALSTANTKPNDPQQSFRLLFSFYFSFLAFRFGGKDKRPFLPGLLFWFVCTCAGFQYS
jgi:hypothetical protein